MITLLLLTFAVFMIFWLGDLYLTIKVIKKVGKNAEANPLMKLFLFRGKWVFAFKALELGIFLYLIYFITAISSGVVPFYILLGYIIIYSLLVMNNGRVYYNVTGKQSSVLSLIFFFTSVILVLFMYLNYLMYGGLTVTYSRLMESEHNYNQLNWECNHQNITTNASADSELMNILSTLNIPIPRP